MCDKEPDPRSSFHLAHVGFYLWMFTEGVEVGSLLLARMCLLEPNFELPRVRRLPRANRVWLHLNVTVQQKTRGLNLMQI